MTIHQAVVSFALTILALILWAASVHRNLPHAEAIHIMHLPIAIFDPDGGTG